MITCLKYKIQIKTNTAIQKIIQKLYAIDLSWDPHNPLIHFKKVWQRFQVHWLGSYMFMSVTSYSYTISNLFIYYFAIGNCVKLLFICEINIRWPVRGSCPISYNEMRGFKNFLASYYISIDTVI